MKVTIRVSPKKRETTYTLEKCPIQKYDVTSWYDALQNGAFFKMISKNPGMG